MNNIKDFLNFEEPKQLIKGTFIWLFLGCIVLGIAELLRCWILCYKREYLFLLRTPEAIQVAAFFLILIVLFHFAKVILRALGTQKDTKFSNDIHSEDASWIFNGGSRLTDKELVINSSRAGCLLEKRCWKDFTMSFDFQFSNNESMAGIQDQKLFGIIFRAKDLDNYFMLEIGCYEKENRVKPHIRYKGGLEELAIRKVDSFNFDCANDYRKFKLEVIGTTADLYYQDEKVFTWELPTHVDVNHYESGVREDKAKEKSDSFLYQGHVQKIPFRTAYGLIGFRSYWKHAPAKIKNLVIKPIESS